MNKTLRIALACFLGATLGAVLALHFNRYFWWLGILIGGLTGYLSYEFKSVLGACTDSWRKARAEFDCIKFPPLNITREMLSDAVINVIAFLLTLLLVTLIGCSWL